MKFLLGLGIGATLGALTTYYIMRKEPAEEVIVYSPKDRETKEDKEEEAEDTSEDADVKAVYTEIISNNYITPEASKAPYAITERSYYETFDDFEKEIITYFEYDGVLANDDLIFDDLNYTIGLHSLELFGSDKYDDPDIIYVRNEAQGVDYKVICEHMAYTDRYPSVIDEDDL